ncbi:glycoside hydrolase family 31 protein [Mastigocoleus sp. MO_188.B34]|uniref:glycoside hydrolase family 31 protein n=1 Tax=Mastigocoleus sp. MO_188.B34 TaxID=3036635 RepID=UPI00262F6BAE|nr:glycoside hydrolase family 31 protein [Mastigocoleus sp. MO_188.B34]MDJ0695704.1 glycoside hydrolase family 31 protein [Mastigocoleus sp. MO_188.B34]
MPEFIEQLPCHEPQWNQISSVERVQTYQQGIFLICDGNLNLTLSVLAPNLIRVRFSPTVDFIPRRSWSVAIADEEWDTIPFEIEETEKFINIKTAEITVCVQRDPCRIVFIEQRMGNTFAGDTDLGIAWRQNEVACWKQIGAGEKFYGFGERTGLLNQRGKHLTHWNTDCVGYEILTDEMYQAIPFFMSLSPQVNYGLFFNTTYKSQFDVGANQSDILQLHTQGNELDYYLIYGQEPATILNTYTKLTGRMSLPPRWALGYHQCRWSYNSETEVRTLAREFRQRRIPCDVIHLDIDYMQGFRVFTWHKQRFPDPKKLIDELTGQGFKVVTIVDPGVKYDPEADYEVCDRGLENNYFIRNKQGKIFHGYVWPDRSVFPDFIRSDVREWWSSLHKNLINKGVAGIWNDMNEPALDDRPFGDSGNKISFPLDAPQGDPEEQTNHAETHNIYGLMMARASREALDRLRPKERSFVLTRSGYAGVQKYSAVWTGDNHSLWEHLEMSLPMLCNLGLSGVPFVGADIGGFASNATPELFARWMQIGMLYPLMRGHSVIASKRHEPWEFGTEVEDICRQYIELRYQLLPYIYTLFWEAANTGAPILRPLLYHYSDDHNTQELYDQLLLGESLMAAPVYRPGVEHRAVYLPQGTWYDWWTGECYQGSKYILAHAPLAKMPMYIRGGSIIPLAPVMQYTSESAVNQLRLRVTPGTGEYTLYEDDGTSFAYRDGLWSTTNYQVNTEGEQVIIDIQARQGNWNPAPRQIIVEVVGKGVQEFTDDGTARKLQF